MTSVADVLGDRYRIARLIGRGGMSDVYEAVDLKTGDDVAIKIVRSGDPEFRRRLEQEARALESFEHPGLIRLLDVGSAGDQAYLVMELIVGTTLAQTLRAGALSSRETANLGARLADTLVYVHARGVVHRDVKPSNILLSVAGDAWLGDFGIARLHDTSLLTATGTTMGTVSYMAPEQLEDHQVGPAADIWSLGIILLECLTARRVYEGTPSEVLARRLAGPVVLPAELPVPWRLILTGMLAYRVDERLEGVEVAALLASSAYDAPWSSLDSDVTTQLSAGGLADLTAMMPGALGGAVIGEKTRIIKSVPTVVAPPRIFKWQRRYSAVLTGAVVVGIALFLVLGSKPVSPQSSTTTTSPVTTTTVLAGTAALGALKSQVLAGEVAGSVNVASGNAIVLPAVSAQTAYTTGDTQLAVNGLVLAASAISNGILNHTIGSIEGQLLQGDLALLATALNLSSALTPPTTTTTTSNFPPPGKGHGPGKN